jgi:hypothetical protein
MPFLALGDHGEPPAGARGWALRRCEAVAPYTVWLHGRPYPAVREMRGELAVYLWEAAPPVPVGPASASLESATPVRCFFAGAGHGPWAGTVQGRRLHETKKTEPRSLEDKDVGGAQRDGDREAPHEP